MSLAPRSLGRWVLDACVVCLISFRSEVVSAVILAIDGDGAGALGGGRALAAAELVPSCVARAMLCSWHYLEVITRSGVPGAYASRQCPHNSPFFYDWDVESFALDFWRQPRCFHL